MQPLTRSLSLLFLFPVTVSLLSHTPPSTPFFHRSIFQTLSIILTLVDYTRAGGILPWRRRVAASLKFHTRWPTYQILHLGYAWLVHPNIRHPEYFLPRESAITRLWHHPSLFRLQPLRVLWKTVYGKNDPSPPTFTRRPYAMVWRRAMLTRSISKVANEVGKVKESSPCRKKLAKYGATVLTFAVYGTLKTLKIAMVF